MAAPPTETRRDLLAGIAIFLGVAAVEAITTQGWSFLFTTEWKVDQGDEPVAGIWGMLYGSVLLSVIGLVIAVPVSLLLSVFIVFLAPRRLGRAMTNVIDLMAAIPSIILGLWVIAGFVLGIMMIPIITSVSREVLGRTPPELINAAEALGCSLWTMLRHVALPYGRGGIVGGIMLGLGRALGETIAIFFVLKLVYDINWYKIIESEGGSVATLIVATFGEVSGPYELNLLLAAGFFLFVGTLVVNVIANLIVQKTGRSER